MRTFTRSILSFSVVVLSITSFVHAKNMPNTEKQTKNEDKKCRILSLRGGGVHGAWEVGVLKALVDIMPPGEIEYDHVAGVSIGAYNASVIATYPIGSEKEAVD